MVGNVLLSHGMRQVGKIVSASPLDYVCAFANPWAVLGVLVLIFWMIGDLALLSRADLSFVLPITASSYVLIAIAVSFARADLIAPLGRVCVDHVGCRAGARNSGTDDQRFARGFAVKWILVGVIAICNTLGDVLNTAGMKRQGELESLDPRSLGHMLARIVQNALVLSGLGALAVSFFALLSLLSISDVSFAVPATAMSYILETLLAKYILKEHVKWRRWAAVTLVACGVVMLSL